MTWYDIWNDMIWHAMTYEMTWNDMIGHDMTWYDMIWHDMTWYHMIWHDMTWYDMIWHDYAMIFKKVPDLMINEVITMTTKLFAYVVKKVLNSELNKGQ